MWALPQCAQSTVLLLLTRGHTMCLVLLFPIPSPQLWLTVRSLVSSDMAPWTAFLVLLCLLWQLLSASHKLPMFLTVALKSGNCAERGDICQHTQQCCEIGLPSWRDPFNCFLGVQRLGRAYFTAAVKKSVHKGTCACPVCRQHWPEAAWSTPRAFVRKQRHPLFLLLFPDSVLRNEICQTKPRIWAVAELGKKKLREGFSGLPCLSWSWAVGMDVISRCPPLTAAEWLLEWLVTKWSGAIWG